MTRQTIRPRLWRVILFWVAVLLAASPLLRLATGTGTRFDLLMLTFAVAYGATVAALARITVSSAGVRLHRLHRDRGEYGWDEIAGFTTDGSLRAPTMHLRDGREVAVLDVPGDTERLLAALEAARARWQTPAAPPPPPPPVTHG